MSSDTLLAFDAFVTARGSISGAGVFGNVLKFTYGGWTWKLVSGSYQKGKVFSKEKTTNGVHSFSDKARGWYRRAAGTYRLGGENVSIAQNYCSGTTATTDFYYSDFGGQYYASTTQLKICHADTSTTVCP